MSWPLGIRRAFLLLLPLSIPGWAVLNLACILVGFLREIAGMLHKFWSGRTRSLYSHDDYYR